MSSKPVVKISLDEAQARIAALDFGMLKFKLTHPTLGCGWTQEKADRVEREYRNYLWLIKVNVENGAKLLPPSHDVDEFWHHHILDTRAYQRDCAQVFGMYLHHFPYFGMRGAQDYADLQRAYRDTDALYRKAFGASLTGRAAK